jgi:4-hydroxy-tetrahydrodipicolinate synthase
VARCGGDPAWKTVRPPLVALSPEQGKALDAELEKRGFTMPGWQA